jgi:hypothetical protein
MSGDGMEVFLPLRAADPRLGQAATAGGSPAAQARKDAVANVLSAFAGS